MTTIDYEALAKAAYYTEHDSIHYPYWDDPEMESQHRTFWRNVARAVIAALRDQGLVVVRADDALRLVALAGLNTGDRSLDDFHALNRVFAAANAALDGESPDVPE